MDHDSSLGAWVAEKRFLVVEDVDISRLLVSGLLRSAGAVVVETAADGKAALAKMEKKGVPDIMFCDWNMAGMDGLTLLSVVKEKHPAVKFIMLTANIEPEHVRAAAKFKADGYIGKPFTRAAMIENLVKLKTAEQRE